MNHWTRRYFALLFVTTLATGALLARENIADPWDAAGAAKYLDARMDVWWANAKILKTGDAEQRCISCHTAVPYVLARPRLGRMLGETTPTAHETRILETARARTRSIANMQPYYDNTDAKKIESRGVEAVINALVLTSHDVEAKAAQPSDDTRTAMARLWEVQREDGSFDWLNFGLEPYEAPDAVFHGAAVAAMSAGSAPGAAASATDAGRAGRDRLVRYLNANVASQRLFNRAWALVAASRLTGVLTPADRAAIVRDLEAAQRPDGGWSMNDLGAWHWDKKEAPFAGPGKTDTALLSAADGYATGLAVFALKESRSNSAAIAKGQQWLRAHQSPVSDDPAWAPWRAHSLNFDREHGGPKGEPWRRMFMSDLATAFAVLALTDEPVAQTASSVAIEQKLDTPQVRVYVATLQPHAPVVSKTGHATNRVLIYMDDGRMSMKEGAAGATNAFKRGDVRWRAASGAYTAENTTDHPIRILEIDLKDKPAGPAPKTKLDPTVVDPQHYKVEFENEYVRVLRVKYGPNETGANHEHLLNRVVFYVNDQPGAKADEVRISGAATHVESNKSDQPAERIAVEIK